MRALKIYSPSSFQICNAAFLTTVTMLYITSPWCVYFITGGLYLLTPFTHFSPTPAPPHLSQPPIKKSDILVFDHLFGPSILMFCSFTVISCELLKEASSVLEMPSITDWIISPSALRLQEARCSALSPFASPHLCSWPLLTPLPLPSHCM